MSGFVHVDIAADDPDRAARFYNRVFNWTVTKLEGPTPYWLVTPPDNGVGAGIARRESPWQRATPTIDVASVDEVAERVVAEGGEIVVPKTSIPGVGQLVTFRDSEGNVLAALEAETGGSFAGGPPQ